MENNIIIAFIFDSGKLGDSFYGQVVFEHMLKEKELSSNSRKVIISSGDLITNYRYIDIEPYVINDEICTVDLKKLDRTNPFLDFPFCWIIEDIDISIAQSIDRRLKESLKGYVGITKVDPLSENDFKQFWKRLPRTFAINNDLITVFQDPKYSDRFIFETLANDFGYKVEYEPAAEYSPIELLSIKQSSFVKSDADREIKSNKKSRSGTDRNVMILNFDLNKELHIAGDFIWKSIVELSQVPFSSESSDIRCFEHSFFVLYNAAQGVERLQKILVELISKKHHIQQAEVETANNVLLSHAHHELNSWIANKEKTSLDRSCVRLFCVLQDFYKNYRYRRYADVIGEDKQNNEYDLLKSTVDGYSGNDYDTYIKKQFGKIIGTISYTYFKLIRNLCHDINIFAYEIDPKSTAVIVFSNPQAPNLYTELLNRQNEKKELIYWLLKNRDNYPRIKFLSTPALAIDPEMVDDYISDMIYRPDMCEDLHEEINTIYDDVCSQDKASWKKHLDEVQNIIANSYFGDE